MQVSMQNSNNKTGMNQEFRAVEATPRAFFERFGLFYHLSTYFVRICVALPLTGHPSTGASTGSQVGE